MMIGFMRMETTVYQVGGWAITSALRQHRITAD